MENEVREIIQENRMILDKVLVNILEFEEKTGVMINDVLSLSRKTWLNNEHFKEYFNEKFQHKTITELNKDKDFLEQIRNSLFQYDSRLLDDEIYRLTNILEQDYQIYYGYSVSNKIYFDDFDDYGEPIVTVNEQKENIKNFLDKLPSYYNNTISFLKNAVRKFKLGDLNETLRKDKCEFIENHKNDFCKQFMTHNSYKLSSKLLFAKNIDHYFENDFVEENNIGCNIKCKYDQTLFNNFLREINPIKNLIYEINSINQLYKQYSRYVRNVIQGIYLRIKELKRTERIDYSSWNKKSGAGMDDIMSIPNSDEDQDSELDEIMEEEIIEERRKRGRSEDDDLDDLVKKFSKKLEIGKLKKRSNKKKSKKSKKSKKGKKSKKSKKGKKLKKSFLKRFI